MVLDDIIVRGLQKEGWVEEVSLSTSRLLHKQSATIKMFCIAEESPQVVKVYLVPQPEVEE